MMSPSLKKPRTIGGRNAPIQAGDYTFDTGPTFLHQKFTLDEVFAETGRKPEDYMELVKLDPMTTLTWGDVSMETSFNPETMARNIEAAFPGESANYQRFMDDHAEKLRTIFPCLLNPYHKLSKLFASRTCSRPCPMWPHANPSWMCSANTSPTSA